MVGERLKAFFKCRPNLHQQVIHLFPIRLLLQGRCVVCGLHFAELLLRTANKILVVKLTGADAEQELAIRSTDA